MFAKRPVQGKKAAQQVTKGSISGSSAASSTRPSKPATALGPAAKQTGSSGVKTGARIAAGGGVPSGLGSLKRSVAPAASSRNGGKAAVAVRDASSANSATSRAAAGVLSSSSGSQPSAIGKAVTKAPETDDLQEASQAYAWLYMASTLDEARKKTEKTVLAALETRSQELAAEEEAIAEARTRFKAEQLLEFYDVLSHKEAPALRAVTEAFIRHEAKCADASSEALRLHETRPYDVNYLNSCINLLSQIDALIDAANRIESDIVKLPDIFTKDQSKMAPIIRGLLSLHCSRLITLTDSYRLVEGQKKSAQLHIELQSLEIA